MFALLFCLLPFSKAEAQTTLKGGKVPADLLITLKRQGGNFGGIYSEITITANGDWSSQSRGGLPVVKLPEALSIDGKPVKLPKYLRPKLSDKKLKLLIAAFERIQFFKFSKDFPLETEKEHRYITHQPTDTISIRINGQIKEVSNYLGNSTKRTRLLWDLAERIRGSGVWNYENDEIPENFQVSYRITDGNKIQRDFKIESTGKVIESYHSSRYYPEMGENLPVFIKSETLGKLSKRQLRGLIDEFEKSVFSAFRYSPLSKYSGCLNEPDSTTEKRKHINVQINHVGQMYASLYENCNPKPETDAARFEYMSARIEETLKKIKVIKSN
jgi:hypothetical protein